jgi:hypothetical protein
VRVKPHADVLTDFKIVPDRYKCNACKVRMTQSLPWGARGSGLGGMRCGCELPCVKDEGFRARKYWLF